MKHTECDLLDILRFYSNIERIRWSRVQCEHVDDIVNKKYINDLH